MAQIERRKGTWGTPLAIAILIFVLGVISWGGLDILNSVRSSIIDLKNDNSVAHDKLWQALTSYSKKTDCLAQVVHRCCPNDTVMCL